MTPATTARHTERSILDLLHLRYGGLSQGSRLYAVAEHVPASRDLTDETPKDRIVDFLAQHCHMAHVRRDGRPARWVAGDYAGGSARIQLHGHEVKVTRADWVTEMDDPTKAEAWKKYCDRWWLVAPADVVRPGELPDGWGLLVPTAKGLRAAVVAPLLDPEPLTARVRASIMRRVQATAERRGAEAGAQMADNASPSDRARAARRPQRRVR